MDTYSDDEALYMRLQRELILNVARSVRETLASDGIGPGRLATLTAELTWAVCHAVDTSSVFDGNSPLPIQPAISFAGMGIPDNRVLTGEGTPALHEFAHFVVEQLFEEEP